MHFAQVSCESGSFSCGGVAGRAVCISLSHSFCALWLEGELGVGRAVK